VSINLLSDYDFTYDLLQINHILQSDVGCVMFKDNSSSACTIILHVLADVNNLLCMLFNDDDADADDLLPHQIIQIPLFHF